MNLINSQNENKLDRKAFTLIELLAVIVILSIIALITVPIIISVLERARMEAFRDSAYGIINAVKLHYADKSLDGKVTGETFEFPSDTKLKITGEKPKSGSAVLDEEGGVAIAISNGKWCATKTNEEEKVTITDYSIENCVLPMGPTPASCFTVNETGETITKYICDEKKVVIPKKINGITITKIGPNSFGFAHCTSIEIPDSIVSIENYAFYSNWLTNVKIPNSVVDIKESSFSNNMIKNLELSASVEKIWPYAFSGNQLTNVTIPNGVKSIGISAFVNNQLTSIQIPLSVTRIGAGAFNKNNLSDADAFIYNRNSDGTEDKSTIVSYGGAKMSDIRIPNGVEKIGDNSFEYLNITSIEIPNSVTEIGSSAFRYTKLTNVIIPSNVKSIRQNAFSYSQLTNVQIENGVEYIADRAFYNNQLTNITIPTSVIQIDINVFSGNQSNMKVTVNKPEDSITGSPWGAASVEWIG